MNILVACEESQTVCKAFRERGHIAFSCDLQECSGGRPEWHICGDCLPILNGNCFFKTQDGKNHTQYSHWDMVIAHPPCTKTSNAGARHLWSGGHLNLTRYYEGMCGKALFMAIWKCECNKVVIENPTPSLIFEFPKHSQVIQPYEYGHPVTKRTLLWVRGVPLLTPTNIVYPTQSCHDAHTWFSMGGKKRQRNRSKTFPGIAKAMAQQWG